MPLRKGMVVKFASLAPKQAALVLTCAALSLTGAALLLPSPASARQPSADAQDSFEGRITYYARKFAGRPTASGERFDPAAMTMAHRTLPLGTRVLVTNLANSRTVTVRVNDRGPHIGSRIGDVSPAAARVLGMTAAGIADARLEVLGTPAETRAVR